MLLLLDIALPLLLNLVGAGLPAAASDGSSSPSTAVAGAVAGEEAGAEQAGPLRIDRGPDQLPLVIPRDEELTYEVGLSLGMLGEAPIGLVTLTSGVEPYRAALPRPGESVDEDGQEVGWIRTSAQGHYFGHDLDHKVEVRHLPQVWPHLLERNVQRGSRNTTNEVRIGRRDDQELLEYRRDHHCPDCKNREHFVESSLPWAKARHCKKCDRLDHRVWKATKTREIPPHAVDMLSAINAARSFIRNEVDSTELLLIRKDDLWTIKLRRGGPETIGTPAGRFQCRRIGIESGVPPGEEDNHSKEDFEGLFGLHGDLRIYVHDPTGIPVVIEGEAPVGPFNLKIVARLKQYRGTDAEFVSVER